MDYCRAALLGSLGVVLVWSACHPLAGLIVGAICVGVATIGVVSEVTAGPPKPLTSHGSAEFATPTHLRAAGYLGETGLIFGRLAGPTDRPFLRAVAAFGRLLTAPARDNADACLRFLHAVTGGALFGSRFPGPLVRVPYAKSVSNLTLAPPGAGKTTGVIMPNVQCLEHSCVVVDPKGEVHAATADHRRQFGAAVRFVAPMDPNATDTIDPLDGLTQDSPTVVEDARAIAEALVERTGHESDKHWANCR